MGRKLIFLLTFLSQFISTVKSSCATTDSAVTVPTDGGGVIVASAYQECSTITSLTVLSTVNMIGLYINSIIIVNIKLLINIYITNLSSLLFIY